MQKLSIVILLSLLSVTVRSQSIGNKKLSEIDVDYIEIEAVSRLFTTSMFIELDYGQKTKLLTVDDRITDENGINIEFNSMIDALNFMSKYGYEFLSTVPILDPELPTRKYILKKKRT